MQVKSVQFLGFMHKCQKINWVVRSENRLEVCGKGEAIVTHPAKLPKIQLKWGMLDKVLLAEATSRAGNLGQL